MWTCFYFEIFSSTSHPLLSEFDLQFLFEQILRIEHSGVSLESRESGLIDKQLHQESLLKIKGVKPPYLSDNNLAGSLRESLQDPVSYGSGEYKNVTFVDHRLDRGKQNY